MNNSQRFRFPKTVLFGITALYIIIMLATYFLYYNEPTVGCAKRLLIAQTIALIVQVILNYINYHSHRKIVVLATLFVSTMIVMGVISSFFTLELMCGYYGIDVTQ
ncbi:hypothetical protein QRD02_13410 [Aequorivita sp. SDUM287046]|uniref:Uncharacterized protein n=1 Tax=Aequorivita aurantiaca TaxID=3053356 RepID=A0ABT8DNC2_9FLAO|nr:hypothetical protein [Aequorivita aurantiaca]MDN3725380.1 hypothetical protein [Aequorivita aurantiaca]